VAAHAEAICSLRLGDVEGARSAYERAVALDAKALPVRLLGAWVALHDRDLPLVESRTAELMTTPAVARSARGLRAVARLELGDASGAASDLEALMEETPEADLAFNLGLSYVALGRLADAEAAFTEASELPGAPESAKTNRDAIATLVHQR
jgi:Flp pilus assembly protein TadD